MQTDLIRVKREEKFDRDEISFSIPTKSATNTNPIRSNDQLLQLMGEKMLNINSYVDNILSSTSAYNNVIPTGHKGKQRQVKKNDRTMAKVAEAYGCDKCKICMERLS